MTKCIIEGNTLRLKDDGTIAVSATRNFHNKWRWHSSIVQRSGKCWVHKTAEAALRAGAKQLGVEVVS